MGLGEAGVTGLVKRSFALAGHRTSVALEIEFWDVLAACAAAEGVSLARLVASIDVARGSQVNLASALRIFALQSRR